MDTLKLLFQLYVRPASAMSEIIDRGSWLFAAVLVFIVSIAFFLTINNRLQETYRVQPINEFFHSDYDADDESGLALKTQQGKAWTAYYEAMEKRPKIPLLGDKFFSFFSFEPAKFYQPLLSISIFYVPFTILLISIFGGAGAFGVVLSRSYGELATCTLTAWAAAHLPFAVAGLLLGSSPVSPLIYLAFWAASSLLFGVFMVFALRTVFGANYGTAVLVVALAWISLSLGMYVFRFVSPWFFSPFLLFYAYMYFGGALSGEVRGVGSVFRRKQDFKRFLHNATVNPRDADAHVQLGLIYLKRRQEAKALEHLNMAFGIDPQEIDANYELGKIARQKGDLQTALDHFGVVVEQNEKHSLSEIWREIGATYLAAGMLREAREALEKFVARRPVDSEGLYHLGKVLKSQGDETAAREMFQQAIESANTAPLYRRRELRYWSKLAEKAIDN